MRINISTNDLWQSDDRLDKVINLANDGYNIKIDFERSTAETEVLAKLLNLISINKDLDCSIETTLDQQKKDNIVMFIWKKKDKVGK